MARTRTLTVDDGRIRRYEIRDDGVLVGYDTEHVLSAEETNAVTLRDRARQAVAANVAYLALSPPTAAQTTTQVRLLTRQCTALIRLLLENLESTDGA